MRNYDAWRLEREKAHDVDGLLKVHINGNHLVIWRPKAINPYVNLLFRTTEARDQYLTDALQSAKSHKDLMAERKEARKAQPDQMDSVKLGDIFHWSWGYDQTNCDFFQVTKKIGKSTVELTAIGAKSIDKQGYSSMSTHLVAMKDNFLTGQWAKVLTKRVRFSNGVPYVSMCFGWCDKWDGKPEYNSWYA
jgi:hypothetical protein